MSAAYPWQVVKYGVIGLEDLRDDLTTWRHLYVAGRLHKPVAHLATHPSVLEAQQSNVQGAAAAALLLLPPAFTMQVGGVFCWGWMEGREGVFFNARSCVLVV